MIQPSAPTLIFDVNETLLDMGPVHARVNQLLGKPDAAQLWFTRSLQYALTMTVSEQYANFPEIAAAALKMLTLNQGMTCSEEDLKEVLKPMTTLSAYPEVDECLKRLESHGYQMAVLTNSSTDGMKSQLEHAGLSDYFVKQLSVESLQKYKPHKEAYTWSAQTLQAAPADCMLIAAHGWDVAGAKWAGMKTAFIARPGQQLFPLADAPDLQVQDMRELADALCE